MKLRKIPGKYGAAVLVAGALALGGSSFALWSATTAATGGSITAGDLNVTLGGDPAFFDVSADRTDTSINTPVTGISGHAISDPSTWRMVPGDEVAMVISGTVVLSGDNLVADLALSKASDLTASIPGELAFAVYSGADVLVARTVLPTAAGQTVLARFAAPGAGQGAGASEAAAGIIELDTTTTPITVVVFKAFDEGTSLRASVNAAQALTGLSLTLTQVRDGGLFTG